MKNIREYFDYLFTLERTGMKYDLVNIRSMLKTLGDPHNNFKSIHIAGTNGKGATASFIASILMEHGLKTGLYTSPHILKFNERIRINSKCISDAYIKKFLNRNQKLISRIKPSFFEVTTAMAFEYFAKNKVDIAVIECGLGGRLDSTNVLKPAISVITQIGMDHMQYLGNSLKKITIEKLGIVKPGIDVIVSDNNKELKKVFENKIIKNRLFYLDDNFQAISKPEGINKFRFGVWPGVEFSSPFPRQIQARNAGAATAAAINFLLKSGIEPDLMKIKLGLANVKKNSSYRARLETVKINNKTYILDVSHNPGGLKASLSELKSDAPEIVIFGIMSDKDVKASLAELLRFSKTVIFTRPTYKRAAEPEMLIKTAQKLRGNKHNLYISQNISEALKIIKKNKIKGIKILIAGSFFLVSDAIKALHIQKLFK